MFELLAAAALSAGGPIYLNCELVQYGEPMIVNIMANEASQRATISLPTGRVVERLAIFSPSELRINDEQDAWIVDRVTLGLKRIVTITDETVHHGACKVAPQPTERAF